GSWARGAVGEGCGVGDLWGLAIRRLPPGIRGRYSPGREVASIPDWEERLEAVAGLAARQDMRLVSGMPSWLVILFERVARHRRASGRPRGALGAGRPR